METYKITDGFYRKIPRDGQFRGQDKIFIINYGKNIVITNVLFFYLRRCIIITKIDPKDYIGKKFNHLTITSMFKNEKHIWQAACICDCGNKKNMNFFNVRRGFSKTCGCGETASRFSRKHSDTSILGQKFGRLTVIKDSRKRAPNGSVLWECKCDCGNITYKDSSNLKRGHAVSCGCFKQEFIESLKIDVIGKKFGFLTVVSEVFDNTKKRRMVKCRCDCGKETIAAISDLTSGHTMSCGCMRQSKGEMLVEKILKKHQVKYETQKRFDDCFNKKKLPFDFYLPDSNICIEYQGEQHYRPVKYWGGLQTFKIYQKNDFIKKEYCNRNNIQLLCLPYTLTDFEIEKEIINILNP